MAGEPLHQNVAVTFVNALLYGLYFSTFLHCIRWLLFADEGWKLRGRKDIPWSMLVATLLLFFFSLASLVLELRSTLETLQTIERTNEIITVQKPAWVSLVLVCNHGFVNTENWINSIRLLQCTDANLSILVGDLVMVNINESLH